MAGQDERVRWQWTYGFAFSGDYLAAFLVKELVAGLLSNLQGPGGPALARFENVCELVSRFHGHFFREIKCNLGAGQNLEFFFGGFCPVAQRVRIARFQIDPATRTPNHVEILTRPHGESFETLGNEAGRDRFTQLFDLSRSGPPCRVHYAMLRRLRDVILDEDIPSVAGAIQYGEFRADGNFHLAGTGMITMGTGVPEIKFYVRGTDVDAVHQPAGAGLYLGYSALLPFDEDIQSFDPTQTFWTPGGTQVALDELITCLPHDRRWADSFIQERRTLKTALGRVRGIEHVGSTAVPALPAVPFIDILVGAATPGISPEAIAAMTKIGYEYLGPLGANAGFSFRKRSGGPANVFLVQYRGVIWEDGLVLRDFLRSHPAEAEAFGREKVRLLNSGGWTLCRYNQAKNPMQAGILARARHWAATKPKKTRGIIDWFSQFTRRGAG